MTLDNAHREAWNPWGGDAIFAKIAAPRYIFGRKIPALPLPPGTNQLSIMQETLKESFKNLTERGWRTFS